MNLIKPKAPRFYRDVNGVVEACYKVPVKNKKFLMDEGHPGTKEPTIADARELGLLPSVTTILGVLAKPGLERWKLEQAIHSALTLPRAKEEFTEWKARILSAQPKAYDHDALLGITYHFPPGSSESEDSFAKRVVQDMDAQAATAAEFGTRIHDAIACILGWHIKNDPDWLDPEVIGAQIDSDLLPYLSSFKQWANDNIEEVHAVEKVVGGKHCGYAGRLDLDCTLRGVGRCVVDLKSQAVKEGKKPTFYDEFPLQLAAYRRAEFDEPRIMANVSIASIIIDSRSPGPVHVKVWERDRAEVWNYEYQFQNAFSMWKYLNNYAPEASS